MGLGSLKTNWIDGMVLDAGTINTNPNLGSFNTFLHFINLGIGSTDSLITPISLNTGSLSVHAGSLSTHAGSLTAHAGSLSQIVGSLSTHAGSLSTHAGSLSTLTGTSFANVKFLELISTDTKTDTIENTDFVIGNSTTATYTISGGTLKQGDVIIVIGGVTIEVDTTADYIDTGDEYTFDTWIRIALNSGTINGSQVQVSGWDISNAAAGNPTVEDIYHGGAVSYTHTIATAADANNNITITLRGNFTSATNEDWSVEGNLLILAARP